MGKEDQVEEREVLESIFPEEITDISDNEYRVTITIEPPEDPNGPPPPDEPLTMLLHVRYPDAYPDEPPILDLLSSGGASSSYPLFSVADDKTTLLQNLEETVQENLGMAMVFTLVTALKEAAEQLIGERLQAAAQAHEEKVLAAEREENKKFQGEPVNAESFMRWREGFLAEMAEKKAKEDEEKLADAKKNKIKDFGVEKLTGKQLWERGLAKGDDEDEGDLADGVEGMKVAA